MPGGVSTVCAVYSWNSASHARSHQLVLSGVAMPTKKGLVGLLQGLSRGVSGQSPDSEQVEQLQSELQQRGGQVQKLKADLEYSQDELQDLQRHCRSLEVHLCCPDGSAGLAASLCRLQMLLSCHNSASCWSSQCI